jgi:hypothetical protein
MGFSVKSVNVLFSIPTQMSIEIFQILAGSSNPDYKFGIGLQTVLLIKSILGLNGLIIKNIPY